MAGGADGDQVHWRDGATPVSRRFDDPYFSLHDGLAETRHVFHGGNDLPARLRDGFHIAELGFGTGLNLMATLILWRRSGRQGRVFYTSFEAYPMKVDDMERALTAFPEAAAEAGPLIEARASERRQFGIGGLWVEVIAGDARDTLPLWSGKADAWYLDGFSPAKNPELWNDALLAEVARHTAPGGTFATYTAAGHVRRALQAAGFEVARHPGYGRKRHMTRGRLVTSE